MEKKYIEKFMWEKMRSKTVQYPVFGEVIHESLTSIYQLLERTKRTYTLFAYVRKTGDGLHENVLHIQMHFNNIHERDTLWDKTSEHVVKSIQEGMKKATEPEEKLEIENILCSVRCEK